MPQIELSQTGKFGFLSYILLTLSPVFDPNNFNYLKYLPPFFRKNMVFAGVLPPQNRSLLGTKKNHIFAVFSKKYVLLKRYGFTRQNAMLPHSALLTHGP